MFVGETTQASATVDVTGGASQTVTWSSSATSVATIDDTGLITAVGEGTTTITATSTADTTKFGTATLTVALKPNVVSVTPTLDSSSLLLGDTTQAAATVVVEGGASQTVTWSSSATSVATVDSAGLITSVGVGTTIITATSTADSTKFGTATLDVVHPLAGRSVLYFVDLTLGTDILRAALDAAVLDYGVDLTVASGGGFVAALAADPDLVVYNRQGSSGFPTGDRDALAAWVVGGGYLAFTHWDTTGTDVIAMATDLQASFDASVNHASLTVNQPEATDGLSSPTLTLTNAGYGTYSVGLDALAGGTVIATHDDDDSAAIVSGNDGRTLMIGFFNDALPAVDGQQLYTNLLTELMLNWAHAQP